MKAGNGNRFINSVDKDLPKYYRKTINVSHCCMDNMLQLVKKNNYKFLKASNACYNSNRQGKKIALSTMNI